MSPEQLRANRGNASKSAGPRTPEGKARVSLNAVTHGLTSTTMLLLPDEAPDEFMALAEHVAGELAPVGLAAPSGPTRV
jgi:hypothetical protein